MAHAGEKVVLRLVQLLYLLLLLNRKLVLLFVQMGQEQKQKAGEPSHQNHRADGIKIRLCFGILHHILRMIICYVITCHCLRRTEQEKHAFPLSLQGNDNVNKTEHKPLRHPAVNPAPSKKHNGKQTEQKHHCGRGPPIDIFFLNTDPHGQIHKQQASRQQKQVCRVPAHNQHKEQGDHADACDQTEHALSQADPVVKDIVKPFLKHANSSLPLCGTHIL